MRAGIRRAIAALLCAGLIVCGRAAAGGEAPKTFTEALEKSKASLPAVLTPALYTVPYGSYSFDYWARDALAAPAPIPYEPVSAITGERIGAGPLSQPADMAFDSRGRLYILDSGNRRIVICDSRGRYVGVISSFDNGGAEDTFNRPQGICVDEHDNLHIADTENRRIVSLTPSGRLIRTFGLRVNSLTGDDFVFNPLKVGVDGSGRYYVVARNMFQGIMSFEKDGTFFGFFGAIKTADSAIDRFWKYIATQAQRERMALFVPTEFTNLDIDRGGFVYTTHVANRVDGAVADENTIRKLNPSGKDVLINYNTRAKVNGDVYYRELGPMSGPTKFLDIKVRPGGIYTALDNTRMRLYTYDSEGHLLYVFGAAGNQVGTFRLPVAVEALGDEIFVLDQAAGTITMFAPTRYGALINAAIGLRYDGAEAEAVRYWNEVLALNPHYELAYAGIGKSLLAQDLNAEALPYLQRGMDKRYYSVAYRRHRNQVMRDNIHRILAGAALFIAASTALSRLRRRRAIRKGGQGA
ncbi:MAG: gluconolactonase [Clostridiales bacterium]|nr:gluconolactonase [Clostridiales bacterium]